MKLREKLKKCNSKGDTPPVYIKDKNLSRYIVTGSNAGNSIRCMLKTSNVSFLHTSILEQFIGDFHISDGLYYKL